MKKLSEQDVIKYLKSFCGNGGSGCVTVTALGKAFPQASQEELKHVLSRMADSGIITPDYADGVIYCVFFNADDLRTRSKYDQFFEVILDVIIAVIKRII